MSTIARIAPALTLALAIAACQQQPAGDTATADAEGTAPPAAMPSDAAPPAADAPSPTPTASPTGIPATTIPASLQGRWGMVPADCTSTRGDAKGLLGISATTLTFYESVARLGSIKNRTETFIQAEFSFTGEGMEWSREESLTVKGDTLTRTETGGDEPESAGPFTYTRCS